MDAPRHMFAQLKNRPDNEHEQVLIRVGLAIFALVFLFIAYEFSDDTSHRAEVLTAALLYLAFSISLTVVLWFDPKPSPARRFLGIAVDMGIVTYALTVTGATGAPLYGGYLWAIIANGFRFGKPYLYFAQALAVVGFSFVIITNPFWSEYPMFGIGLLIWLIVIPPYVSILLSRLSEALSQAKRADQAKTHFLANMSHELRTPLHTIMGFSECGLGLEKDLDRDKVDDYFNKIHHGGEVLLALVDNLLDVAKLEAGKIIFNFENVNYEEIVIGVVREFDVIAEQKDVKIMLDVKNSISDIDMDSPRMQQVVRNLISNAVKFTSQGSEVLVVLEQVDDHIQLRIYDHGPGIPVDELENIFDKFIQSSRTNTGAGGTGLGLSICREILSQHNAIIWAENNPEGGAIFIVNQYFEH